MSQLIPFEYLHQEYDRKQRSIRDIAKELDTYPVAVYRALIYHGITPRNKSAAQLAAYQSGRKEKATLTEDEKHQRRDKLVTFWEQNPSKIHPPQELTTPNARRMKRASYGALRAATYGSRLTHILMQYLHDLNPVRDLKNLPADFHINRIAVMVDGYYRQKRGEVYLQKRLAKLHQMGFARVIRVVDKSKSQAHKIKALSQQIRNLLNSPKQYHEVICGV